MCLPLAEVLAIGSQIRSIRGSMFTSSPIPVTQDSRIVKRLPAEFSTNDHVVGSTALIPRGTHVATWEILDDHLYVKEIRGFYRLRDDAPIVADWYSGTFVADLPGNGISLHSGRIFPDSEQRGEHNVSLPTVRVEVLCGKVLRCEYFPDEPPLTPALSVLARALGVEADFLVSAFQSVLRKSATVSTVHQWRSDDPRRLPK